MKKKKRTYNHNLIRTRSTYTFKELAEVFRLHTRTIQGWRKTGLMVLDEETKPFLILGEEIIHFLKEKRQKRKHPLNPGEFFCITCRTPRCSQPDKLSITITDKWLGKTARQAFIRGICEVCGRRLTLFSSDKKVQKMPEGGALPTEYKTVCHEK